MTCIFLQPYVLSSTFVPLELNVLSMPKSIHTLSHSSFKIHFSYKSFSDPLPTQTMLGSLPRDLKTPQLIILHLLVLKVCWGRSTKMCWEYNFSCHWIKNIGMGASSWAKSIPFTLYWIMIHAYGWDSWLCVTPIPFPFLLSWLWIHLCVYNVLYHLPYLNQGNGVSVKGIRVLHIYVTISSQLFVHKFHHIVTLYQCTNGRNLAISGTRR